MFEEFVNQKMGTKQLQIHIPFIPVARNPLIPGLLEWVVVDGYKARI